MDFDQLDTRMRAFETSDDTNVPQGPFIVVRVDGRSFTAMTVERGYEKPFDERFQHHMIETTKALFHIGLASIYGYVQSDEISILLALHENAFNRKTRKLISIMAGEASAAFTHYSKHMGAFDARLSILPNVEDVVDYFRWRQEDARRNALNAYCYWTLRQQGRMNARQASRFLERQSVSDKKQLLLGYGIDFDGNRIGGSKVRPSYIRGVGVYWQQTIKHGFNPLTKEAVSVPRKVLYTETRLPERDTYQSFLIRDVIGFSDIPF